MSPHIPSLRALTDADEDVLSAELSVAAVRSQAAVVRALVDEVDRTLSADLDKAHVDQKLVEETARLGCRVVQTAAAFAHLVPPSSEG